MEIKVDLTPEDINREIAAQIAKSAIGNELQRIIEEEVKRLSSRHDNPFKHVVARHIEQEINRLLVSEPYRERVRAYVEAQLTEEVLTSTLEAMWNTLKNNIERNRY